MQRASITIRIERDGEILAEREFGQDDPKLDDLREMFMATLFHRLQKLGSDVFDAADEQLEKLEAAASAKPPETKPPVEPPRKKPQGKKKRDNDHGPGPQDTDSSQAAGPESV